jgi:hypothetical protein
MGVRDEMDSKGGTICVFLVMVLLHHLFVCKAEVAQSWRDQQKHQEQHRDGGSHKIQIKIYRIEVTQQDLWPHRGLIVPVK